MTILQTISMWKQLSAKSVRVLCITVSISLPHLARAVVTTYGLVRWSLRMRRPGSRGWCAMTPH